MNRLKEIEDQFLAGRIDKWEYIERMYKNHIILFDYVEFLKRCEISNIEISANGVIFTFGESLIKFLCTKGDKRLAPIDALNFGSYENGEMNMALNLIKDGDIVLDIGANLGWYAMNVAQKRPGCYIYSFEPIPRTFSYLEKNIQLNGFRNIAIYNLGLSEQEALCNFYYDETLSVNASLRNMSNIEETQVISCQVTTLDNFVCGQSIPRVDFIKCDVEGSEYYVFRGGEKVIKRDLPIIYSEMLRKWAAKFNYHPNDIVRYFYDIGYRCFALKGNKLRPIGEVNDLTIETNFFFLHEEKHQKQICEFQDWPPI